MQRRRKAKKERSHIDEKLQGASVSPTISCLKDGFKSLDWDHLPHSVDPTGGDLNEQRAGRKRDQINSIYRVIQSLVHGKETIVDFCSGGVLYLFLFLFCTKPVPNPSPIIFLALGAPRDSARSSTSSMQDRHD